MSRGDRPTVRPRDSEIQELRRFERRIEAEGEWNARLLNLKEEEDRRSAQRIAMSMGLVGLVLGVIRFFRRKESV